MRTIILHNQHIYGTCLNLKYFATQIIIISIPIIKDTKIGENSSEINDLLTRRGA